MFYTTFSNATNLVADANFTFSKDFLKSYVFEPKNKMNNFILENLDKFLEIEANEKYTFAELTESEKNEICLHDLREKYKYLKTRKINFQSENFDLKNLINLAQNLEKEQIFELINKLSDVKIKKEFLQFPTNLEFSRKFKIKNLEIEIFCKLGEIKKSEVANVRPEYYNCLIVINKSIFYEFQPDSTQEITDYLSSKIHFLQNEFFIKYA